MRNKTVIGVLSMIRKHLNRIFIDYAVNAVFKLLPVTSKMTGINSMMGSKQITMPITFSLSFILWLVSEI